VNKTVAYLCTLKLVDALWWYIENITHEHEDATAAFFYLRERVRNEH
jgi:hypothetical protein